VSALWSREEQVVGLTSFGPFGDDGLDEFGQRHDPGTAPLGRGPFDDPSGATGLRQLSFDHERRVDRSTTSRTRSPDNPGRRGLLVVTVSAYGGARTGLYVVKKKP